MNEFSVLVKCGITSLISCNGAGQNWNHSIVYRLPDHRQSLKIVFVCAIGVILHHCIFQLLFDPSSLADSHLFLIKYLQFRALNQKIDH